MSWLERRRARRAEEDELIREFDEHPPALMHVGWGPKRWTRRDKIRWARIHRKIMREMKLVRRPQLEHVPTENSGECSLCGAAWPCLHATAENIRRFG